MGTNLERTMNGDINIGIPMARHTFAKLFPITKSTTKLVMEGELTPAMAKMGNVMLNGINNISLIKKTIRIRVLMVLIPKRINSPLTRNRKQSNVNKTMDLAIMANS
jgi:hypothetical protein